MDFRLSEGVQQLQQAAEASQAQAQDGPEVVALQAGNWQNVPQTCDQLLQWSGQGPAMV